MNETPYAFWLTLAVTLAYVGVAIDLYWRDNWPLSLVYAAYAVANIGFMVIIKNG